MPITFELVTQIKDTFTFWKALIKSFLLIYHLSGFDDVSIFPLFSVMTSLWHHITAYETFDGII